MKRTPYSQVRNLQRAPVLLSKSRDSRSQTQVWHRIRLNLRIGKCSSHKSSGTNELKPRFTAGALTTEAASKLNGQTLAEAVERYLNTVASVKRKDVREAVEEFTKPTSHAHAPVKARERDSWPITATIAPSNIAGSPRRSPIRPFVT